MDKKEALDLATRYASAVVKEMDPDRIVLYGSYAKGTATEESDIDVAVIFENFTGDWLGSSVRLSGLCWDISTYIEPILLDSATDESGFVEEIMKHGELLYQA